MPVLGFPFPVLRKSASCQEDISALADLVFYYRAIDYWA